MSNFTTTFTVQQSPAEVFRAINDVRAWWSGDIEGPTDQLGGVFTYRYKKVHRTTQKITELVPNEKVVWHVTDSYVDFAKTDEWTGTDIVFEIAKKGDATEVRFTHVGLEPARDCYEACEKGWTFYVQESLRALIARGRGQPNGKTTKADASYTKRFTVGQTPEQVFAAINDVRGWWSKNIEGRTDQLGAKFVFRYEDLHRSTHHITELEPGKRVVWHTDDAELSFVKNKSEWTGTDVIFEIGKVGDATEVCFTHVGLVPTLECYGDCSRGWGSLLDGLRTSITEKSEA